MITIMEYYPEIGVVLIAEAEIVRTSGGAGILIILN